MILKKDSTDNKNSSSYLLVEKILKKLNTSDFFVEKKTLYYFNPIINTEKLSKVVKKPMDEILSFFWNKGLNITKNKNISEDLLIEYCKNIGLAVNKITSTSFNDVSNNYLDCVIDKENSQWQRRTPVISVMGHVDHGKTTLVDTICCTTIQKKEVGNITQKITAIQIEINKQKFVFLDTPGHETFIGLRQQGISLTDVVVLVIDSKEGIKEQTEEIIKHLRQYNVPTLIFINYKEKTGREDGELTKIQSQLQSRGLTPTEWGGDTIILFGSAKDPSVVNKILDNIFLLADPHTNFTGPTYGVTVDSYIHPRSNSIINKFFIQGGTLKVGDYFFSGGKLGRINLLKDSFSEKKITQARPGEIVLCANSSFNLELGEKFVTITPFEYKELSKAMIINFSDKQNRIIPGISDEKKNNVNLFLVSDSQNSLKTIVDLIKKHNSSDVSLNIICSRVGQLSYSDLELIRITRSIIIAFATSLKPFVIEYTKEHNIVFFENDVIYQILKDIEGVIEQYRHKNKVVTEEVLGEGKIKAVFEFSKGDIAGCQITKGIVGRNNKISLWRDNLKIYSGTIKSLQVDKNDVKEVRAGQDCGIILNKFNNYKIGDKIVSFRLFESIDKNDTQHAQ